MDASFSFIVIQCFIFIFVSEFPAGEHLRCSSWLHPHGKWTSFINGLHLYSFSCLNSHSELFTLHSQTHSYSAFPNIFCVLFPTIHTHSHSNDTLGLVSPSGHFDMWTGGVSDQSPTLCLWFYIQLYICTLFFILTISISLSPSLFLNTYLYNYLAIKLFWLWLYSNCD